MVTPPAGLPPIGATTPPPARPTVSGGRPNLGLRDPAYPVRPPLPGTSAPAPPVYSPPPVGAPNPGPPQRPYGNPPPQQQRLASNAFQPAPNTLAGRPPIPKSLFEPAQIIATVNGEPILAGDVEGLVNQVLAPAADAPADVLEAKREELMRQYVKSIADIKMMYLEFLRALPPERRATGVSEIWSRVYQAFDEEELPKALKKRDFRSAAELDAHLRQFGWSLMKQKRLYGERQLGQAGILRQIERDPEVTHDEMVRYYRENIQDYSHKPRARWEQLTVHFSETPDRNTARRRIAEMGNAVYLGTPLAAVAKRSSDGYRASEGGLNDWVSQGSLVSKPLDSAIFGLPLHRLSRIIEDDKGLHIIRVVEREEAYVTAFTEKQVEIRDLLRDEKRETQFQEVMEAMRARTTVWTIFDDPEETVNTPAGR